MYSAFISMNHEPIAEGRDSLIGGGSNHRIPTLQCIVTADEVRLDPKPLASRSLVTTNLLFAFFFLTILWWCYAGNPIGISIAVIVIWIFTSVLFTARVLYIHAKLDRLGPALIYHRQSKIIELPRCGQKFTSEDNVWIECITAQLGDSDQWTSELNFVALCDGVRERWNLDRSSATINPFKGVDQKINEQTGISVVRRTG